MSAHELFNRLTDDLPGVDPVVPVVFIDDDLLPATMALVDAPAFALACVMAVWGPCGPRN